MKKTYLMAITALMLLLSQTAESATVEIHLGSPRQTIRGFGGMNFPRWIGTLTNAQVDKAFGNGSGQIGFTIMRIDVPYDSSQWSGEVSAAVRAKSHEAIILATPWTPPPWMKTNNDPCNGELKTDCYDDYADHLSDFADYMSSNGASLYAISVQNEPDYLPKYESCGWSPSQMQTFLNSNASVIPTKVLAPETCHYKSDYVSAVASSSECDIVGVHAYGGSITSYSGKEYWMTEHYTNTNPANDWPDALGVGKEIHDCMTANMSGYIWWYIRRSYGPLDESGNVTKRGYVMSHFAKFVRPGYVRVSATYEPSSNVYTTAYKSGDTLVIVAVNRNSSSREVTFSLYGGSVDSYTKYETTSSNNVSNQGSVGSTNTLAANSINTFVGTISGGLPGKATNPSPGNGVSDVSINTDLSWTAGAGATSHDVYFGTDSTPSSSEFQGNQPGTTFDPGTLSYNTTYYWRIDEKNASGTTRGDVWSFTTYAPDTTPPEPDPTWASPPTATGPYSITMTSTTATDAETPPVYYYFECTNYGDANSGWQLSETYVAQGLTPSTQYTFRVKARDDALIPNETAWSTEASAITEPPSTDVEILGDWETGLSHTAEAGSNRVLIFTAHAQDNQSAGSYLDTVTYGGQYMTEIREEEYYADPYHYIVSAWILDEAGIAAASGSNFVVSWSDGGPYNTPGYSSVFLQNVDQTTPVGPNDGANCDCEILSTGALATSDSDMVMLTAFHGGNSASSTNYECLNGFTEALEFHDPPDSGEGMGGYKAATGVSETPSVDSQNNNYSGRQALIGFVVQAASVDDPPAAPTGLVATAGNEMVSLDWNDNNEPDLAGYNVYRSTTQGSGHSQINSSLVINSDYVDNDVDNGTPYYYVVKAVDANDQESGYSNEDSAIPDFLDCDDVQAGGYGLKSDLDCDCYVDCLDLAIIAYYWLDMYCGEVDNCEGGDFEPDGDVDFVDFSTFALQWMQCNNPGDAECTPNW